MQNNTASNRSLLYGSEGKGNIAYYLAPEYDVLMRVGGPNAGHKVPTTPQPYTHRLLPSGTRANPSALLLIGPGATLDDSARSAIYSQVVALLTQDAAWLNIVSDKNPRALAPNVKGFVQPKSWFADLTTVTVG